MSVASKKSVPPSGIFGSDAAPIIYFDGVLAWGYRDGVVQLELAANHLVPMATGSPEVKTKVVVTAHLRCSVGAATQLMDAIEKLTTTPPPLQN